MGSQRVRYDFVTKPPPAHVTDWTLDWKWKAEWLSLYRMAVSVSVVYLPDPVAYWELQLPTLPSITREYFTAYHQPRKRSTHEEILNTAHSWRNADQNYNEVSPHTSQNGNHQKNLQTVNAGEGVEKRDPSCTVGGNVTWYNQYREPYGGSLRKLKIQNLKYGFYRMGNALAPS